MNHPEAGVKKRKGFYSVVYVKPGMKKEWYLVSSRPGREGFVVLPARSGMTGFRFEQLLLGGCGWPSGSCGWVAAASPLAAASGWLRLALWQLLL
eukprot:345488-Chlamydomonas_euryale.AAC.1